MAKFCGNVGFVKNVETFDGSGIFKDEIILKKYHGDVVRNQPKWDGSDKLVDDININNRFDIVANSFARDNLGLMRFIEYGGTRWRITSTEISYPRIIIYAGGIYNG